eukprot:4637830-Amphidinium_carterae.2
MWLTSPMLTDTSRFSQHTALDTKCYAVVHATRCAVHLVQQLASIVLLTLLVLNLNAQGSCIGRSVKLERVHKRVPSPLKV